MYLRVTAQNNNALKLANFLLSQDWVDKVYYPGLKSHPDHEIAKTQMKGFGGMLTFDLNKNIEVEKFLNSLKIIKPSMSLAGVESTVLSPKLTSHALLFWSLKEKNKELMIKWLDFQQGLNLLMI